MGLVSMMTNRVYMPFADIPPGKMVRLPGRGGSTYVTDTPGPDEDAPTVILLHALGCTGLLTWFPAIAPLSKRFRVVTMDQRWHGRGIHSEHFSLHDCADDVAALIEKLELKHVIVAGFSMGSIVAQRVWRQHPDKLEGLVLCATTDKFQLTAHERFFFSLMGTAMAASRSVSHSRVASAATRAAVEAIDMEPSDIQQWALREFRSTSPWAVAEALAALGRHHSRPWLSRINVPTAVVLGTHDKVIPPSRQLAVARAIPGATIHDLDGGHAMCVLEAEKFVPVFVEAVNTVNARRRDFVRS